MRISIKPKRRELVIVSSGLEVYSYLIPYDVTKRFQKLGLVLTGAWTAFAAATVAMPIFVSQFKIGSSATSSLIGLSAVGLFIAARALHQVSRTYPMATAYANIAGEEVSKLELTQEADGSWTVETATRKICHIADISFFRHAKVYELARRARHEDVLKKLKTSFADDGSGLS